MVFRSATLSIVTILGLCLGTFAWGHHSPMLYDRDKIVVLEGYVSDEMDGFPHWQIKVRMDGKDYNVDLGNEYILREAGLHEDGRDFRIGDPIKVEGYLPVNPNVIRIVPLRIYLNGKVYNMKNQEF
jgi:hypothetical protein